MDFILEPLDRLRSEISAFYREKTRRLLHVRLDECLRHWAVETSALSEWSPLATTNVVVLESGTADGPFETLVAHWQESLAGGYDRLRKAYLAAGVALGPYGDLREAGDDRVLLQGPSLLEEFAERLAWLSRTLSSPPAPTDGVTLVLAPPPGAAIAEHMRRLISTVELAEVRWIWLDTSQTDEGRFLVAELGPGRASACECTVDPRRQNAEISALLDTAVNDASPCGEAWPTEPAPHHVSDGPQVPTSANGIRQIDLSRPFLRALRALNRGDLRLAMDECRRGRRQAMEMAVPALAVEFDLLLTTVMSVGMTSGRLERDVSGMKGILRQASAEATHAGVWLAATKAELALAELSVATKELPEAVNAYDCAAASAEKAGVSVLAVEALAMSADLLFGSAGPTERLAVLAAKRWKDAVEIGEAMVASDVEQSRAAQCAGRLAEHHRHRREYAEAQQFEDRARALEGSATETEDVEGPVGHSPPAC